MSVDYAIVERARLQAARRLPVNEPFQKLAAARYGPFMTSLKASGVTRLREGQPLKLDDYRQQLGGALGIAVGK